jgi:DNA-binding transcriptional LysR family regulator
MSLYASAKYVARKGSPQTLEELKDHECIVLRTETGTLGWRLVSESGEEHVVEPRGAISADDISFMKKAVLAAGGIALLPQFVCAREERSGKLVRVLTSFRLATAGSMLHVVYPSARYVPQRVILLRDYLVKELTKISTRCTKEAAKARTRGTDGQG